MTSTLVILILTIYQNLFVNSQFPNENIPFACWDSKSFMLKSIWKLIYVFHYDLLDPRYYAAIRIGAFTIYAQGLLLMLRQPKVYNKHVHIFKIFKESLIITILTFLVL
jgi:hypothetical protein